ncbi:glycosyltransferase involved in cell wall biosynthesis [Pontibacter aydingkolensis]|uniref:Glycosyltransferase family 4 protein n=1 Tax=Pontibacter aydingkolensis TaxID=1911536 RepID=A0ABS7CSC1_9BACT|nr:glycosyltransferase family 4 protein [Pontibacter aydingkolensis]MBW7466735.1 glycosyltransferase family 4 protein [Pontibacter aydingkolensis]
MRILIIHNHYKEAGGEDTVFFAEANLLEEHGHEVRRLTFSNSEVKSIKQKIEAAFGVIYNRKSAEIIENELNAFRPDVVHVHNFFPLVSPAVFYICHKYKVPVVMTLHNYRLICPSALLHYDGKVQLGNVHKIFPLEAIRKKVYRNSAFQTASIVLATGLHKMLGTWRKKVAKFIVLTPGAADLFLNSSLNLKPEQVVVKPNFSEEMGIGTENREDYYLYIGRLTPEKGIETLLKAQQLHPFNLKIVGDGPLRSIVEQQAIKQPGVEYLGFRKREEAMQLLKKAKALIFPSEWMETFGMTIIEAFATGTPVIASKIGGAAHLVQHKYNGLHYTPQQAEELAEQVEALEQNPVLADELGKNARATYEQHFTPEANYNLIIQIYQSAMGQKERLASGALATEASL